MGFRTRQCPADSMRKRQKQAAQLETTYNLNTHLRVKGPQLCCNLVVNAAASCHVCSTSLLSFLFLPLLSPVMAFCIKEKKNVLPHYLDLCIMYFTTYIETCTLKRLLSVCNDAVVPPLHKNQRSLAYWDSSRTEGKKMQRIIPRSPALHSIRLCEPSGRKQQRIRVRKLLPLMKSGEMRLGDKAKEQGRINKVIFSHRQSRGPVLRITQYGAITWRDQQSNYESWKKLTTRSP